MVVLWLGCRCLPSVNTICGRIMIGLSLLSHNTTTYCVYWRKTTTTTQSLYHILCLLTDDNNDNPIIIRPHIVFTSVNTICGRIMIGLSLLSCVSNTICGRIMIGLSLLSSVSKHNMWSCYDWVVVVVRLVTDGRQRQPNDNTTTYCVYWRKTTTTQS
jgi:hypothetical protein